MGKLIPAVLAIVMLFSSVSQADTDAIAPSAPSAGADSTDVADTVPGFTTSWSAEEGDSLSLDPWVEGEEDSLLRALWIGSGRDSVQWRPGPDVFPIESTADSSRVAGVYAGSDSVRLQETSSVVVRYGAGGTYLPGDTKWKRYPSIGVSLTNAGNGPGFYLHTALSALELRETERVEHLLWMVDGGFAMRWAEGKGFVGLGISLRSAGSFFEKDEEEEEEEEEEEYADEEEDDGDEWWWPIKDCREFTVLPQVYVRLPLGEGLAVESSFVGVHKHRTLVGGWDIKLMVYFQ